jgi:predicted lipid-binding transport protein (Tim44 family)
LGFVLAAALTLAPALVEAKAGGSSRGGGLNAGSRGAQTNATPSQLPGTQARPQAIQRTTTPAPAPAAGQSWAQRNPFMAGMMGGLLGAGIGALLFGGLGDLGLAGFLGAFLQILLIGGLVLLAIRFFRRRAAAGVGEPAPAGGPLMRERLDQRDTAPMAVGGLGSNSGRGPAGPPVALGEADERAFTEVLTEVQAGWSAADTARIARVATPEMVGYFADALADNGRRGIANQVSQVELTNGNLVESWSEDGRDYVSAVLTWNAVDIDRRIGGDGRPSEEVVSGDPSRVVENSEMWTFVRGADGRWLLSAIQQLEGAVNR